MDCKLQHQRIQNASSFNITIYISGPKVPNHTYILTGSNNRPKLRLHHYGRI